MLFIGDGRAALTGCVSMSIFELNENQEKIMAVVKSLFGDEVLMNAALWVAQKLSDSQRRLHKIFKILWFADLSHLKKYGRTITGDTYFAMKNGPVPTILYDEMKNPSNGFFKIYEKDCGKGFVEVLKPCNEEFLSDTDKQELQESFEKYKDMDFGMLSELSHKEAWRSAGLNNSIRLDEILNEIGADEELRKYVQEYDELRRIN